MPERLSLPSPRGKRFLRQGPVSVPKGRLQSVSFSSDESQNLTHHVTMGDFDALHVRL